MIMDIYNSSCSWSQLSNAAWHAFLKLVLFIVESFYALNDVSDRVLQRVILGNLGQKLSWGFAHGFDSIQLNT